MRQSLLLFLFLAAVSLASADDRLKIKVVSASDRHAAAFVMLAVEYPDTIVNYETDRKGRVSFSPLSYPLTVTARCSGMLDSTIGLMSAPDRRITMELTPDPSSPRMASSRKQDRAYGGRRRLTSTFIVRTARSGDGMP